MQRTIPELAGLWKRFLSRHTFSHDIPVWLKLLNILGWHNYSWSNENKLAAHALYGAVQWVTKGYHLRNFLENGDARTAPIRYPLLNFSFLETLSSVYRNGFEETKDRIELRYFEGCWSRTIELTSESQVKAFIQGLMLFLESRVLDEETADSPLVGKGYWKELVRLTAVRNMDAASVKTHKEAKEVMQRTLLGMLGLSHLYSSDCSALEIVLSPERNAWFQHKDIQQVDREKLAICASGKVLSNIMAVRADRNKWLGPNGLYLFVPSDPFAVARTMGLDPNERPEFKIATLAEVKTFLAGMADFYNDYCSDTASFYLIRTIST